MHSLIVSICWGKIKEHEQALVNAVHTILGRQAWKLAHPDSSLHAADFGPQGPSEREGKDPALSALVLVF